jgi:hypothetical protein
LRTGCRGECVELGRREEGEYASPNIIRVIKSRRMRWVGHVARIGEINAYNILDSKAEGKRPLRRPRRRWKIILEWILGNSGGRVKLKVKLSLCFN